MDTTKTFLIASAAMFALCAPAAASSVAAGSVSFSLAQIGGLPAGVDVEIFDPTSNRDDTATGAGEATSSATGNAISGAVSASSTAPNDGTATAGADYGIALALISDSFDVIGVDYELTYSIAALAASTEPFLGDAQVRSFLEILVDGLSIFSANFDFDIDGLGEDSLLNAVVPFTVAVDGFADVEIFSEVSTFAESVAPVPLPASGLLLLGALGGFAGLRRRRTA